jgi:DNA-binding response OmpR family regulator
MEKKIRVALVEDHLEIREGLSYIINNTPGFFCEAFENAEVAAEGILQDEYDIVLIILPIISKSWLFISDDKYDL